MMEVYRKGARVTGLSTACRVEKSLEAAGSQATVSLVCAPGDYYLPKLNPACGDEIAVTLGGRPLFEGAAERAEFSSDGLGVSLVCFDPASRLAKNELYGAFSGTPGEVAHKVILALGLTPGEIWPGRERVFISAGCAQSGHSIIRQAYGGRCVIRWQAGAVDILEPGGREITLGDHALLGGAASVSVAEMVNRAEIVGYKRRRDASARRDGDIEAYGLRQQVFSLTGARGTARAQAAGHLRGPVRRGEVRLLGGADIACGDSRTLAWDEYGLNGRWLVTRAAHEMQAGVMITRLGLEEDS